MQRNYMKIIKDLQQKRKKHDQIIQQLLSRDPQEHITQKQMSSKNAFPTPRQSIVSHASDIDKQVNFLTNLNTATQQSIPENANLQVRSSQLHQSFIEIYGRDIKILSKLPDSSQIDVEIEGQGNFTDLVSYLQQNERWDNIIKITKDQEQFIDKSQIKVCSELSSDNFRYQMINYTLGKPQFINLAHYSIRQNEKQLILLDEQSGTINIGFLLLYRGISGCNRLLSKMLNKLFGFPVEFYDLNNQLDSTRMIERMVSIHNQSQSARNRGSEEYSQKFFVLGLNKTTQKQQELCFDEKKLQLGNMPLSKLFHLYSKVSIIHEEFDLISHKLSLKHHINHYVVVDIVISDGQCCQQYISLCSEEHLQEFRICILDNSKRIIYSQTVRNNRAIQTFLQYGQYTMYIASKNTQTEPSFTLMIQSTSNCELDLRFLPEYNKFTQTIIWSYLSQIATEVSPSENVSEVLRCRLDVLDLCVDIFSFEPQKNTVQFSTIQVQYESMRALCDQNYQKNRIKINKDPNTNYFYAFLSYFSSIKSLKPNIENLKVRTLYL